ncbi:nitrous oxide reductase family maturation protein NosD [Halocynthiibacter sp. C4]|uniref:nitrous oxide reductase family maturation protein NosD n=1 Tax=Halocynthiibacter sp. C4 TaxID=2992758 RepID=UPI00237B1994|nr:nitrous oxide reductase family maturation protein NosD [Halocynthiibacter sp. C4]MDE0590616.1 nitrous oxide reductase family maturation protein NosD [Halocynthiibacter sp. C4]
MRWSLLISLLFASPLWAADWDVPNEAGAIARTLAQAANGDTLRLSSGTYFETLVLDRPVTIDGMGKATIDGQGEGSVITVTGADVTIRGLTVIGSGSDHQEIDSGIQLKKTARAVIVENNSILGNLYGVDIHGAKDSIVRNNRIEGRQDRHMNSRGNGVYVWNAPGAVVEGNDIRYGRDGIFVNTSKKNRFSGNRFRDLRFAVHYMHAHDSIVSDNISLGNHLGYAIMYSNSVEIVGNLSVGDRDHGIMMNYTNKSIVKDNTILETGDKCTFIYNAHKNSFSGNRFEGCGIGIHFTAGSERNDIFENGFINNRTQVKYVGSKWVEWSLEGRGNYWSDGSAFDLDGNGIADAAYRPNDVMDHVLWSQPAAKSLLGSPAVQLIRWSQSAFPALLPGGVIDKSPLMAPPTPEIPSWKERS